jgi:hypothetical protein
MKLALWYRIGLILVCPLGSSINAAGQDRQTEHEKGSIILHVVDGFGHEVQPTEIKLIGQGKDFSPGKFNGELHDLPYGDYSLRVLVPGFRYWKGDLHVRQPIARMTIGMQLGSIDGPLPTCSLSGKLSADTKGRSFWIRLLPLYGNEISEIDVASSGTFEAWGLECGKYILAVVSREGVIRTLPIELTGTTKPLSIQLRNNAQ